MRMHHAIHRGGVGGLLHPSQALCSKACSLASPPQCSTHPTACLPACHASRPPAGMLLCCTPACRPLAFSHSPHRFTCFPSSCPPAPSRQLPASLHESHGRRLTMVLSTRGSVRVLNSPASGWTRAWTHCGHRSGASGNARPPTRTRTPNSWTVQLLPASCADQQCCHLQWPAGCKDLQNFHVYRSAVPAEW